MIKKLREHAQLKGIQEEFKNSNIIIFVLEKNKQIIGFIVDYKESKGVFLQYVTGSNEEIKLKLIHVFEEECKNLGLKEIKTDTFEFMGNKKIFEKAGFKFSKKENITPKLEMLWYKKNLI